MKMKNIFGWLLLILTLLTACGRADQNDTGSDFSEIPARHTRVAAVGDSITAEYFPDAGYPKKLAALLGDDYSVWNFGESNYAVQSTSDNPYMTTASFEESIAFAPDSVILMLGTNDTKANNWEGASAFKTEYIALVEHYLELESVSRLILASPPTVFIDNVVGNSINPEHIATIQTVVRSVAQELGVEFVDMTEKTAPFPEWFVDGIHPTAEGAAEIAQIFYEQLKE